MKKSRLFLIGSAPVLLGALTLAIAFSGPAQGSVSRPKKDELNVVKGESVALKTFTTSYIDIQFPDRLMLKTSNESKGAGIYAQYLFSDSRFGSRQQVGVTIGHLNGLNLSEVSFVRQRAIDPTKYTRLAETGTSITYKTASSDEYMTTILHDSDYVTIVASGTSDEYADLQDITEQAIRSLRWR
jgi:hypothetical protein